MMNIPYPYRRNLSGYLRNQLGMNESDWDVIRDFPMLWARFEGHCCYCIGNVRLATMGAPRSIDTFVERLSTTSLNDKQGEINETLQIFKARYVDGDDAQTCFQGLHLGRGNAVSQQIDGISVNDFVLQVLSGQKTETKEKLKAMLFITHRIRNNFLHGVKSFDELRNQVGNFEAINRILTLALHVCPPRN